LGIVHFLPNWTAIYVDEIRNNREVCHFAEDLEMVQLKSGDFALQARGATIARAIDLPTLADGRVPRQYESTGHAAPNYSPDVFRVTRTSGGWAINETCSTRGCAPVVMLSVMEGVLK
jgi:hypothetical protein